MVSLRALGFGRRRINGASWSAFDWVAGFLDNLPDRVRAFANMWRISVIFVVSS